MKIGNFRFKWHKHKWEKVVLHADDSYPLSSGTDGYLLKVGEKCVAPDCDAGSYRSVYYIYLKSKPEVIKIV